MSSDLDELVRRKQQLLVKQREISEKFNELLTMKGDSNNAGPDDNDGAIEDSRKCLKNLEAAIARAKRPGYFSYHAPSAAVRAMENKNEFKKLTTKIARVGRELDQINAEMDTLERKRKQDQHDAIANPPACSGIADWFAKYGKPGDRISEVAGLSSDFKPNPKVYGGTKHHQAFRSLAVTCKRGNLTK